MSIHVDATEAINRFIESLNSRGIECSKPTFETHDRVPHIIINTDHGDIYHARYIKSPAVPKPMETLSKYGQELGERVTYVIQHFGNEEPCYVTMNMELAIRLLDEFPHRCFFVVFLADGRMFWRSTEDFYNFAMRYHVVNWQPKNGSIPYAVIPLGWLIPWNDALTAPPAVIDLK